MQDNAERGCRASGHAAAGAEAMPAAAGQRAEALGLLVVLLLALLSPTLYDLARRLVR